MKAYKKTSGCMVHSFTMHVIYILFTQAWVECGCPDCEMKGSIISPLGIKLFHPNGHHSKLDFPLIFNKWRTTECDLF